LRSVHSDPAEPTRTVDPKMRKGLAAGVGWPPNVLFRWKEREFHLILKAVRRADEIGRPLTDDDLFNHACIRVRLPDGSLFRWRSEKVGEQVHIDVRGPITLDEASRTRIAILEGTGVGYIFEQDILPDIQAGRIVRVLEDWTPQYPGLCLYYPGLRNLSAGVRAFLDLARELSRRAAGALFEQTPSP
jgi:DNA-binding transcriptional LysR family regulator